MKKILLSIAAMMAVAGSISAESVAGEKSFGPKLGFYSQNTSAIAGLSFTYRFSEHFRLAPEVGCVFRHHYRDAFVFDINAHVPFTFDDGGAVALYPLAGLAYNSWGIHHIGKIEDVDATSHQNRIGANLGAGFDLRCSETLRLNIEAKYVLVKNYSSVAVTAGISYVF